MSERSPACKPHSKSATITLCWILEIYPLLLFLSNLQHLIVKLATNIRWTQVSTIIVRCSFRPDRWSRVYQFLWPRHLKGQCGEFYVQTPLLFPTHVGYPLELGWLRHCLRPFRLPIAYYRLTTPSQTYLIYTSNAQANNRDYFKYPWNAPQDTQHSLRENVLTKTCFDGPTLHTKTKYYI